MKLIIDIETKSGADLKSQGIHKYVEHQEFEVLLIAYKLGTSPTVVADIKNDPTSLIPFKRLLLDKAITPCAFNVDFELTCLSKLIPEIMWSKHRWHDIQTTALYLGLPGGLAKVLKVLKMDDKDSAGTALINKFCVPRGVGYNKKYDQLPSALQMDWDRFKEYAYNDVEREYELMLELDKRVAAWPITEFERRVDGLSDDINRRGVKVDVPFAKWLYEMYETLQLTTRIELCKLTGLANPNSTVQFSGYLASKGVKVNSVARDVLEGLRGSVPYDVEQAIELKLDMSSSIPKKYLAALNHVMEDGRMRGLYKYYGANKTGRWTSSGYQLHNLARTNDKIASMLEEAFELDYTFDQVLELLNYIKEEYGIARGTALGQCVRSIIIPEDDKVFYISDFSAIEARVAAWVSGEDWVTEVFRGDGKIYERTASAMFQVPVEDITHGSIERRKGKYAVLALGYGGGVNALCNFGADKDMTSEEMQELVTMWRAANPSIVSTWNRLEKGFREAFNRPYETVRVNKYLSFSYQPDSEVMFLILPSGRALSYFKPIVTRTEIKYLSTVMGFNGFYDSTYGGKLMENVCQAIARDLLAYYISELYKEALPIVLHVHDEVVVETWNNQKDFELVKECGQRVPDWAEGLPLDVEVEIAYHYKK